MIHIVIEHLQNDTKLIVAFLLYIVDEKCLCCCCCLVALSLQNGYTHRFIRTLYLTKIGFSSIWQLAGSSFRYVVQCVHEGINFDRLKAIDGDSRKKQNIAIFTLDDFRLVRTHHIFYELRMPLTRGVAHERFYWWR